MQQIVCSSAAAWIQDRLGASPAAILGARPAATKTGPILFDCSCDAAMRPDQLLALLEAVGSFFANLEAGFEQPLRMLEVKLTVPRAIESLRGKFKIEASSLSSGRYDVYVQMLLKDRLGYIYASAVARLIKPGAPRPRSIQRH